MKTLINDFKAAIQQSGLLLELDTKEIMTGIGIALACSIIIYLVYRIFYRGTCYSENFNLLLVMNYNLSLYI
jgi:TM2 domain-containing membrane protein YozV